MPKITIKDSAGRALEIDTGPEITLAAAKLKIEEAWGIPSDEQRLIYGGKQLSDSFGRTLSDYNIHDGSTLHLVLRLRAPSTSVSLIKILVLFAGITSTIEISTNATIGDLQHMIAQESWAPSTTRQRLICNQKVIRFQDRQKTLADLQVKGNSVLELELVQGDPYEIIVEMPDGFPLVLEVVYSEPVSSVKRLITEMAAYAYDELQLRFQGNILSDDDILVECRVDKDAILQINLQDHASDALQSLADCEDGPRLAEGDLHLLLCYTFGEQAESGETANTNPTDFFSGRLSDSILHLKKKIAQKTTIPTELQVISYQGRILHDDSTFRSCGVASDQELQVQLFEAKTMNVQLRRPDQSLIPGLSVENWSTVSSLKRKVAGFDGVPEDTSRFDILLSGSRLDDGSTFVSHKIDPKTELQIQLKAPTESSEEVTLSSSEPNALHLLPHKSQQLTNGQWKDLLPLLPGYLRWDVEHKTLSHMSSCWTFTPTMELLPDKIPFTIAGAPVVIPVDYRYPLMGPVAPPKDPHPYIINPAAPLDIRTIASIFKEFNQALGFYILLNGMLQVIVPNGFDCEWASSYKPNTFGGLKVCYIGQSSSPTGDRTPAPLNPAQANATRGSRNFLATFRTWQKTTVTQAQDLRLDHVLEARAKESRSKERHSGRIGVKTRHNGSVYLTMSSHVITSALLARERSALFGRFGGSRTSLDPRWINKAEIYAHNAKVGTIAETFDPEAKEYPLGFTADVSLVSPLSEQAVSNVTSPVSNLGWLSQEGWNNLRRKPENLQVLGDQAREGRIIPSFLPSKCLIVGEGIHLNRHLAGCDKLLQSGSSDLGAGDLETWKFLVSRSVLYRVNPDFGIPGGQSGLALYADGRREDGTNGPGVAGFQSFVQRSGHIQSFDMDNEALEQRLKMGYVAFYGAFQVPRRMRTEHTIL